MATNFARLFCRPKQLPQHNHQRKEGKEEGKKEGRKDGVYEEYINGYDVALQRLVLCLFSFFSLLNRPFVPVGCRCLCLWHIPLGVISVWDSRCGCDLPQHSYYKFPLLQSLVTWVSTDQGCTPRSLVLRTKCHSVDHTCDLTQSRRG